jgi:hypothetical protein
MVPTAKTDPANISLFVAIRNQFVKNVMEKLSYVFGKKAEPITCFQLLTERETHQDVKHGLA